jgi:anaerobic dimethyl sulfoxide reductase subunit A
MNKEWRQLKSVNLTTVESRQMDFTRQKLYVLLLRFFREELDFDKLTAILSLQPEIAALATATEEAHFTQGSSLLKELAQEVQQIDKEKIADLIMELRCEFASQLLTNSIKPAYPCESVYRTDLVMQWPRDEVLSIYRNQSLALSHDCHEPEDHISIELEFMAHLIGKSIIGDVEKRHEFLKCQNDFLTEHLLVWVPNFCQEFAEAAQSPFYKAIAQLTWGFLVMESQVLDSLVNNRVNARTTRVAEALTYMANSTIWSRLTSGTKGLEKRRKAKEKLAETNIIQSGCSQDCGGQCSLSYHVREGRIIEVESHDVGHAEHKPCVRGLMIQYRVYAPDRLKFPLRRVGQRGDSKFVRVSWEEALDEVAKQLIRIRDTYGPAAILNLSWSGSTGRLHYASLSKRFLNMVGGQTNFWGGASFQGALFSNLATYGKLDTGHYRQDLLNSRMIILWGCDPARTIFGSETRYYLEQAKQQGIKIVGIDPRYSASIGAFASQWIPIKPGTDAAMLIAMAYVILLNGCQDQRFLDSYTIGFEKFKAYVLGSEDGIPKSPEWAEKITGVPANVITELALNYATRKPAAILAGFAPGRSAVGEQYHRAASVLAAITGNIGISGGSPAGLDLGHTPRAVEAVAKDYTALFSDIDETPNPVEEGKPLHEYSVNGIRKHTIDKVHPSLIWDNIIKGKTGGYHSDIKMLYVTNGNCLNQLPDVNRGVLALSKLEFMVVHEQFMTPTAKYADIVLPVCTWCERNDVKLPWQFGHYFVYLNKAIEPMYHTKTDLQIFTELANKMGINNFAEKTEDEWLRAIVASKGIPDYDAFKESGFYQPNIPRDYVAFEAQMKDLEHNPFPTPSGKIEVFSQRIADFNQPEKLPAIPKYIESWEGVADTNREKYPLQLLTIHPPNRVHSQLYTVPWIKDIEPHVAWINPADARARNIKNKDQVKVFNDRGAICIRVKVTNRIMPGVISIYEGAWFAPDHSGLDKGGCVNVLTRGEHSPGGAFCSNTALVQVQKI